MRCASLTCSFSLQSLPPHSFPSPHAQTKQEGKAGGNKYAYWVTQRIELGASGWVKLPNVTMDQVVKSRQFKRFLTGDLEASVPSYPPFAGKEKNLLRATIARIVGATSISPDGFFTLNEDGRMEWKPLQSRIFDPVYIDPPAVVPAEAEALNEAFPKPSSELKEPDAWKHHEIDLNKIGRVQAMPEQLDDNGEPIVPEEEIELTPALDSIKPEHWTFRICPGGAGVAAGSVVIARSLLWPGAVAAAVGRRFLNAYVGYGVVYEPGRPLYSPPLPAPIQVEYDLTGGAEDSGLLALVEQADTRVDPTPPKPEGEDEEA